MSNIYTISDENFLRKIDDSIIRSNGPLLVHLLEDEKFCNNERDMDSESVIRNVIMKCVSCNNIEMVILLFDQISNKWNSVINELKQEFIQMSIYKGNNEIAKFVLNRYADSAEDHEVFLTSAAVSCNQEIFDFLCIKIYVKLDTVVRAQIFSRILKKLIGYSPRDAKQKFVYFSTMRKLILGGASPPYDAVNNTFCMRSTSNIPSVDKIREEISLCFGSSSDQYPWVLGSIYPKELIIEKIDERLDIIKMEIINDH